MGLFVCAFSYFRNDESILGIKSNKMLRTVKERRLANIQHRHKVNLQRKFEIQSNLESSKIKETISKYNNEKPMEVCGCEKEENDELNSMQEGTLVQTHGGKQNKFVAVKTSARDYFTGRQYP